MFDQSDPERDDLSESRLLPRLRITCNKSFDGDIYDVSNNCFVSYLSTSPLNSVEVTGIEVYLCKWRIIKK